MQSGREPVSVFPISSAENERNVGMRLIAVASGKGGVGKTHVAVNLAASLASRGRKVLLVDGDYSLANVDVMLGMVPNATLGEVILQGLPIEDALVKGPGGATVIPGSSGIRELSSLNPEQQKRISDEIDRVARDADYVLIDTAAGIGENVLQTIRYTNEVVVVCSPEPTSVVDAYALIKNVIRDTLLKNIALLVNMAPDSRTAIATYNVIDGMVHKFHSRSIRYLGYLPRDPSVADAVYQQTCLQTWQPDSLSSKGLIQIANIIEEQPPALLRAREYQRFLGGVAGGWNS